MKVYCCVDEKARAYACAQRIACLARGRPLRAHG